MKTLIFLLLISTYIFSQSVIVNELMSSNSTVLQDEDGEYSDWIEIHNPTSSTINLNGFTISDDLTEPQKWTFPNIDLSADEYLIVFASDENRTSGELHTNFKISSSGETIILSDASAQIVDQVNATVILSDVSLGRNISNSSEWLFYELGEATPGNANTGTGSGSYSEDPVFSSVGGFYSNSVSVSLSTLSGLANIYYTLDGSDPTTSSDLYSTSINISQTKVLKAKSFTTGTLPSKVVTHTFFINESSTFPIISLSTHPDNFFHEETGIYVEGVNGITGHCSDVPVNWNQPWERPINMEFFNTNGTLEFSEGLGVGIFGGCTRTLFDQKSLKFKARGKYGASKLDYPLFNDLPFTEYETFILRNSGNDNNLTHFRDALSHSLVRSLDIEQLAFEPSIVFLNGEYWEYIILEKE